MVSIRSIFEPRNLYKFSKMYRRASTNKHITRTFRIANRSLLRNITVQRSYANFMRSARKTLESHSTNEKTKIIGMESLKNSEKVLNKTPIDNGSESWRMVDGVCVPYQGTIEDLEWMYRAMAFGAQTWLISYPTAGRYMQFFLDKKKPLVPDAELPPLLKRAPLILKTFGPSSNEDPTKEEINAMSSSPKKQRVAGIFHVYFMYKVIEQLKQNKLTIGSPISMDWMYPVDFHDTTPESIGIKNEDLIKEHEDLKYSIGAVKLYARVEILTQWSGRDLEMQYLLWEGKIKDTYNFHKGKDVHFGNNFCVPDSDAKRLIDAGYGKDNFPIDSGWWSHEDATIVRRKWFKLPYDLIWN